MKKSSKPIIEHIPQFLDYCKKEGLSEKTQENYRRYLNKFISWLKKENKNNLLPHELATVDIESYRLYLSSHKDEKGHSLKKISQNYYLIALRALLGYFIVKDIVSLLLAKIGLTRGFKREKTADFLNSGQIEALLLAPDLKTQKGLRDKAILGTLIATGFKISQITSLNKDQLYVIPGEISSYLKEYLQTRKDKNNALFVNYRAKKESIGGRLIARSIERIVNYYGRKIGLPFLITPEILRWARAHALSNEKIKIQKPQTHRFSKIKNYVLINNFSIILSKVPSTWNAVENIINKEILWLKNNIPVLPESYKENPPFLKHDEIILRKIAILIVSGRVTAVELVAENNKNLWDSRTEKSDFKKVSRHGQEWHRKMMDVIYSYFKTRGAKIIMEPLLNYGRADLGIYFKQNKNIYIEVDTVSLFKLWYNLSTMKSVTFLIIPSENKVIEFNT